MMVNDSEALSLIILKVDSSALISDLLSILYDNPNCPILSSRYAIIRRAGTELFASQLDI